MEQIGPKVAGGGEDIYSGLVYVPGEQGPIASAFLIGRPSRGTFL